MYTIVVSRSAKKELQLLPKKQLVRVIFAIDELAKDPHPHGAIKIKGSSEELWRIRSGDYRVVYCVEEPIRIVEIRRVRHRKDVYK